MLSAELDSEQGYQEEAKQWAGTSCTRSQAHRQMYYVISVFPHSRYSHALWFRVRGHTFRMAIRMRYANWTPPECFLAGKIVHALQEPPA
jgi:leucyl-tRNA synthetase